MNKNKDTNIEWEEDLITEKFIFKAKPVPKHVKQNLLKKMIAENPQRFNKMATNLESKTNLKRTQSMPTNLNEGQFKARPFPKTIFTDFAYEQIREDQRYRTIRKALRQKALLDSSKLPPRMQEMQTKILKEPTKVLTVLVILR